MLQIAGSAPKPAASRKDCRDGAAAVPPGIEKTQVADLIAVHARVRIRSILRGSDCSTYRIFCASAVGGQGSGVRGQVWIVANGRAEVLLEIAA